MEEKETIIDQKILERPILYGMFSDKEGAENAYNAMFERGYASEEINLIMSDETRIKSFMKEGYETEMGNKASEGMATGSTIGGTIGAIVGAIAAIGTGLLIPGLGIVIAGPIIAGLAGVGVGGIAGGMIGALIGVGIPEEKALIYESGVKSGNILIGVHPKNGDDASFFIKNWRDNRAIEIYN